MKRRVVPLLQVALGAGILAFLFYRLHRSGDLARLGGVFHSAGANWPFLLLGFACMGLCLSTCCLRWNLLLRQQGLRLPFPRVCALYLIGHFFSAFMLGATGGDVVKAYYVATATRHRRTEVVTTIFIDRAVGLLAIVLLAAAVAVIRLPFFLAWPQTRAALGFISVALAAAVLAFLLVLCRTRFQRWPFFRRVEQSTSLGAMAGRAYEAFHLCMAHPAVMGRVMGLSVLNHVGGVLLAMNLAAALNAARGFADMLSVTPVISAAASLPLTPGGLGTRETAAIYILETIGIPAPTALALSLLLYATGLAWSVIGGLVYVVYSLRVAPRGRAEPATAN